MNGGSGGPGAKGLRLAYAAGQVTDARNCGRVAVLLGPAGAAALGDSLVILRSLHALGLRALTLSGASWASGAGLTRAEWGACRAARASDEPGFGRIRCGAGRAPDGRGFGWAGTGGRAARSQMGRAPGGWTPTGPGFGRGLRRVRCLVPNGPGITRAGCRGPEWAGHRVGAVPGAERQGADRRRGSADVLFCLWGQ